MGAGGRAGGHGRFPKRRVGREFQRGQESGEASGWVGERAKGNQRRDIRELSCDMRAGVERGSKRKEEKRRS